MTYSDIVDAVYDVHVPYTEVFVTLPLWIYIIGIVVAVGVTMGTVAASGAWILKREERRGVESDDTPWSLKYVLVHAAAFTTAYLGVASVAALGVQSSRESDLELEELYYGVSDGLEERYDVGRVTLVDEDRVVTDRYLEDIRSPNSTAEVLVQWDSSSHHIYELTEFDDALHLLRMSGDEDAPAPEDYER